MEKKYLGIYFMLLAALGFSTMGAAAKLLKGTFNAGQLVFYRNAIGLAFLAISLARNPPRQTGGRFGWLAFRGLMGTTALYTLLYCILHMPLGTAMTYNLTSSLFIALFGFIIFKEYHGLRILFAVILGFLGMLLIYKPGFSGSPWYYHFAGLVSGVTSAIAYLTVGRLARYYDSRVIVLSFLLSGVILPGISLLLHHVGGIPENGLFIISFKWPDEPVQWIYLLVLGLAALFGQYFVTRAYGSDKPGLVSAIGYSNIIFSLIFGLLLGDAFPDLLSLLGITCIISSGIIISLKKRAS
ncbi:MAG TPA: DMT family transporter [Chitinophagaceae bacterium]|nr:DMT family transporter [Chitinophagaceae bacterium]